MCFVNIGVNKGSSLNKNSLNPFILGWTPSALQINNYENNESQMKMYFPILLFNLNRLLSVKVDINLRIFVVECSLTELSNVKQKYSQ